jgi:hypothetical protein
MLIVTVTLVFLSIGVYYLFEDLDRTKKDYSASLIDNQIPLVTVPEVETSKLRMTRVEDGYYLELVDGTGSNLDADLLDEKDSEYFLDIGNIKSGELKTEFYSAIKDLEDEGYIVDGKFNSSLFTTTSAPAVDLSLWSGSSNITKVGKIITGKWNADPITSEYIADKTIALADLAQNGCNDGQTIKWNGNLNIWACAEDLQNSALVNIDWTSIRNRPLGLDDGDDDTVLTEGQVETYITNSAINLYPGSQLNSDNIATEGWVNSQNYLTNFTESDPTLSNWTGSSNLSNLGTVLSGIWNGSPITSQYIQDGTITLADLAQNGCSNDQIIKWNTTANAWICADSTVNAISTGSTNPDDPPLVPSSMDDEFLDSAIDPKWSVYTDVPSTYSITEGDGVLKMEYTSNAANTYRVVSLLQSTPVGSWKVRSKINIEGTLWTYNLAGLIVRNSSNNKNMLCGLLKHTSMGDGLTGYFMRLNGAAIATEVDLANYFSQTFYIEMENTGSNLICRLSTTGRAYQQIYSEPISNFMITAPEQVGVILHPYNTTSGLFNPLITVEWFRQVQ